MIEAANNNLQWDDEADVKQKMSAAIVASAEFRGRPDLIELAGKCNAKITAWHQQVLSLNKMRLASVTQGEQEFHRRQIKILMTYMAVESRRFDAIYEAMNDEMRSEFW